VVELKGNSRQRGEQHGHQLREPIQRAIDFYRDFFARYLGMTPEEMRRRASRFLEPTARTSPELMSEYEGIAAGSRQKLEDIFVLTARYEITYESVRLGECSNIYAGPLLTADGHSLLGQSWDWRPEVMAFRCVLIAHCDDVPDHLMVSECGQPGKYGFNEYGLGIAETGLQCSKQQSIGSDLFVVTIRAMLAQRCFADARTLLFRHPPEATISLLLADGEGHATSFEVTPDRIHERPVSGNALYWHTNHCLYADEPCQFEDSFIRGNRWRELIATAGVVTIAQIKDWLADSANGSHSICKAPDPALAHEITWLQTLCSIAMDLTERTLWVSDGLSSRNPYVPFRLCASEPETATVTRRLV
jgi:isopenicillin-N N-acyltransferase-like protein